MFKALSFVKLLTLLAIPITLQVSIKLNSFNIILCALLFLPDIIKNLCKKKKHKVFLLIGLQAFTVSYLVGTAVDFYHGMYSLKKLERLLPFLFLPLIFFYGNVDSLLKNKNQPLKLFSIATTVLAVFLLIHFSVSLYYNYQDNSLFNKRWKISGIDIERSNDTVFGMEAYNLEVLPFNAFNNLTYDRSIKIKKDTTITRSFYVKADSTVWLLVRQYDGKNHKGAWIDIGKGSKGFVEKPLRANVRELPNGWYRFALTNPVKSGAKRERLQITVVDNNKSYERKEKDKVKFKIAGAQLEYGSVATDYEPSKHRSFMETFDRKGVLSLIDSHPTYFSIFLAFSILICLELFNWSWQYKLSFIVFNYMMIMLLASKAVILSLLLTILLIALRKQKTNKLKVLFYALGAIVLLFLMLYFIPGVSGRFEQMFEVISNPSDAPQLSTGIRFSVWKDTFSLIQKSPILGHGNLYSYELLNGLNNLGVNAHNQYLEALLCSGVVGLILLILYFILPFVVQKQNINQHLFVSFILLLIINLMFENLLNRQWGIVFTAYFMTYFTFIGEKKNE